MSVHQYETKDSGERQEYASGMRRDVQTGKPRFDLILPEGIPYEEQFLTRVAALLARGAEKYGDRNWELAASEEELRRFKASGLRHAMQWFTGEVDEDHAAATVFNLLAYETTKARLGLVDEEPERPSLASVADIYARVVEVAGRTGGLVLDDEDHEVQMQQAQQQHVAYVPEPERLEPVSGLTYRLRGAYDAAWQGLAVVVEDTPGPNGYAPGRAWVRPLGPRRDGKGTSSFYWPADDMEYVS